jgi:hypothetical protein
MQTNLSRGTLDWLLDTSFNEIKVYPEVNQPDIPASWHHVWRLRESLPELLFPRFYRDN